MSELEPTPVNRPSREQRLEAQERPSGSPVMFQSWRALLFLHWETPPDIVQASLPPGLFVDVYDGKAYLGIVPFLMHNVRPRFLPALPHLSRFPEINLRTYVHDHEGRPGVWFYSLDVPRQLAVWAARKFFHLPYFRSRIEVREEGGVWNYRCVRKGEGGDSEPSFQYRPQSPLGESRAGRLEFFLVERYRLFSAAPSGRIWAGRVHHPPYGLRSVKLDQWSETLFRLADFTPPGRRPDHAVFADGVDVEVFSLDPQGGIRYHLRSPTPRLSRPGANTE